QEGHAVGGAPHLGRVIVEYRGDAEPLTSEALVVVEGGAQIAESHEGDLPLAVETKDALELRLQTRDVVADAAHTELAEIREVFPDLGRVQAEPLRQLLRRDGLDPVLLELLQAARVDGQATHRHLGNAGNLERGASRHRGAAPGVPGRRPGTPQTQAVVTTSRRAG